MRSDEGWAQPMRDDGGHKRSDARVWRLTATIALAASVGWLGWGLSQPRVAAPTEIPWAVVLAAFALAELLLVNFEFRGQAQALTLGEVPLIVGLVFCSPAGVLLAGLGGSLVALVGYFRQSKQKLSFNLAMHALKVFVALAVYRAVLGTASPIVGAGLGRGARRGRRGRSRLTRSRSSPPSPSLLGPRRSQHSRRSR